jgi:hypothetical protein
MIELPASPVPNGMEPQLLGQGFIQRGAASLHVDRPGSRYAVTFGYPPMEPDIARRFIARLLRAKRQGLRVKLPLLVPQPVSGTPIVDGVGQAGSRLRIRGLSGGFVIREGTWFSVRDAAGNSYLHNVTADVSANGSGVANVEIEPPLRAPLANSAPVEMRAPVIEGFIDGDELSWQVPVSRRLALGFTVEEYA